MDKQGFAWWAFEEGETQGEALLELAWDSGMRGVDFLPADLWPAARAVGFELLAIDGHPSVDEGLNDSSNASTMIDYMSRAIADASEGGAHFIAVASGRADGRSDGEGIRSCISALSAVADDAKAAGVEIILEPLNTRYDHKDQQCDTVEWARAVIDGLGHPSVRLLFDIYHVQLTQGDIINRLRESSDILGHVHTAGVPGRSNLGVGQELNYAAIAGSLRDQGYAGWVVHEFTPTGDVGRALREAKELFDAPEHS